MAQRDSGWRSDVGRDVAAGSSTSGALGHAIRYVPFYAALFLIGQITVSGDWQPWFSIGGGLVATALAFAYIRLDERYQIKRLAAGDFTRHELV